MTKTPEQELAALKREFKKHTDFVKHYLTLLDHCMKTEPSNEARGQRIGDLASKLQFANDSARRFTLHLDFNGKPLKRPQIKSKKAA